MSKTQDLINLHDLIYGKSNTSDLSSVAFTGLYSDLLGKPDLSVYATIQELGTETTNRQNADNALQTQIDAITVSSDVVDVVGTYQDLQNYDTAHIKENDIIKVLQDSTHNDALSYYRWVIINHVGSWSYVGSEGPFYTKSETNTLLGEKENSSNKVTSISPSSTDDEYPSAKCVYGIVGDISSVLDFINGEVVGGNNV